MPDLPEPSRVASALQWLVFAALVAFAVLVGVLGVARTTTTLDDEEAADQLEHCSWVWSQSSRIYAEKHHDTNDVVVADLTPALARELLRRGVWVYPKPDYPCWASVIVLALLAFCCALGCNPYGARAEYFARRFCCTLVMAGAGAACLFTSLWGIGAVIDLSEDGIRQRAFHHLSPIPPLPPPAQGVFSPSDPEVQRGLHEGYLARVQAYQNQRETFLNIERARASATEREWRATVTVGFGVGFLVIGLFLLLARRAFKRGKRSATRWIALYFLMLMSVPAALAADRELLEPAFAYWLALLFAVWGCWRFSHAASSFRLARERY